MPRDDNQIRRESRKERKRYEKETGKKPTHLFWHGPDPDKQPDYLLVPPPKVVHRGPNYRPKKDEVNVRFVDPKRLRRKK